MSPNNKPQKTNSNHSINYTKNTERLPLTTIISHHMRDYAKPWEDKNVYFRMAKKSKKMLVEDRIPSTGRVKEASIKITI